MLVMSGDKSYCTSKVSGYTPSRLTEESQGCYLKRMSPNQVREQIRLNPLMWMHFSKNIPEKQKKLVDVLLRQPTSKDGPGYIYGFFEACQLDAQTNLAPTVFSVKLGRTTNKVPQLRKQEWERTDKRKYIQKFTFLSDKNSKLQRLVHLLFDYARKEIQIEGKLRIQWFHFEENVPIVTLVEALDTLMTSIHRIAELELEEPVNHDLRTKKLTENKYQLNEHTLQLWRGVKWANTKVGLVGFGDDNKKNIINTIKNERLFSEIEFVNVKPQKLGRQTRWDRLIDEFLTWCALCNAQNIAFALVLKEVDFYSSGLQSVVGGMEIYNRTIESSSPIIIVSSLSEKDGLNNIKNCIESHKQQIPSEMYPILCHQSYFCDLCDPKTLKHNVKLFQTNSSHSFTMSACSSQQTSIICDQIVTNQHERLAELCPASLEIKILQIEAKEASDTETLKIIQSIEKQLSIMNINEEPKNIYRAINELSKTLELEELELVWLLLYTYSFCALNQTMKSTHIFWRLQQKLSQVKLKISERINLNSHRILKQISQSLTVYLQVCRQGKIRKQVECLRDCESMPSFKNAIDEFIKCRVVVGEQTIEGKTFLNSLLCAVRTVEEVESIKQYGVRVDYMLGRIKGQIAKGFRYDYKEAQNLSIPSTTKNKTEIRKPNWSKSEQKSLQSGDSIQNAENIVSDFSSRAGKIESIYAWNQQEDANTSTDISAIRKEVVGYSIQKPATSFIQLQSQTTSARSDLINILPNGIFIFQINGKTCQLKTSVIILARSIQVPQKIKIQFRSMDRPLSLIVLSQNYINLQNLQVSVSSNNGEAYIGLVTGDKCQKVGMGSNKLQSESIRQQVKRWLKVYSAQVLKRPSWVSSD